ncbi:Transcription termination factor MTEF1, chloroplastic, partial [Linum grandiflorum]
IGNPNLHRSSSAGVERREDDGAKVEYLKDGVGLSEEEIWGMVRRFPSLLTFSVENNLKPMYEFFVGEMEGRGLEEIKEFSHYFGFSLENRIKVRYLQVLERGMSKLALPLLLKITDHEFQLMRCLR